ncbi:MAG: XRE family transcriptional regulator [Planctomycetota bacterium]|nr:MAG: XRE family transcriptional regulator [Planctomycetota bacterium]
MEFGEAVRRRRTEMGLSLGDLADLADVSKAMLSEIETGKKNPTLRVACSIAGGLDCQLSDLLDVEPDVRFEKLDDARCKLLIDPTNGVERHLLSPPMVQHGVQVLMFVFPPGAEVFWNADGSGVIEHATCIEGRIRIEVVRGGEVVELGPLESVNFPADADHLFSNISEQPTRVFVVLDSSHRGRPAVMRPMRAPTDADRGHA